MILQFQGHYLSNLANEWNNYFIGFKLRRGAKSNEGIVDLKSYSLAFEVDDIYSKYHLPGYFTELTLVVCSNNTLINFCQMGTSVHFKVPRLSM